MTEPDVLLDTNVLLRQVLEDHAKHSPRTTALIVAVEQGERAVRLTDTAVFEAVFTLEKTYSVPRADIRDALQPILDLPGVVLPGKRLLHEVFALHVEETGLSFADCYYVMAAKHLGLGTFLSFDRKMGRIEGITRAEPSTRRRYTVEKA
jgi:predicted nucleic acid-binding protein